MDTVLHLQNDSAYPTPTPAVLLSWVECALQHAAYHCPAELSVRVVEETEMQTLNLRYRGQDKTTNVLAFSADLPAELALPLLGDIVICAAVVAREAQQQDKTNEAHWAHMLVHGTLHLLGYDHQSNAQALDMEALETEVLTSLAFPPPYSSPPQTT